MNTDFIQTSNFGKHKRIPTGRERNDKPLYSDICIVNKASDNRVHISCSDGNIRNTFANW